MNFCIYMITTTIITIFFLIPLSSLSCSVTIRITSFSSCSPNLMTSLFVDDNSDPESAHNEYVISLDSKNAYNGANEIEIPSNPPGEAIETAEETQEPDDPPEAGNSLDYVQLASIMKDFHTSDPIFAEIPEYMIAIIKELLESDFLLVLGRGLGLAQLVRTFLLKVKQCAPHALVLVLGNHEEENADFLTEEDQASESIGFNVTAPKRIRMYNRGGIYRITAPIAVVDILTKVLEPLNVSGLVISHAERISENSPAAFAIKLLKQRNPHMFVKAFSEAPERLVMPPALPIRLRILQVPTIMLWPRFHLLVDRSLPKLEVDEIIVEQPESVRRQQALLSELFQQVLSDIKRRVPHLDVDYLAPALGAQQQHPLANPNTTHESTTVDSVLATPDLAFKIRGALQGVWHQLSREGKRSVHALGTLAQLQHTLTQHDAVQFREELELCCKDSDQPWVDLPATDLLVSEARTAAVLSRVPAKFTYLMEILKGIENGQRVLIVCSSAKTVLELMEYLEFGPPNDQNEDRLALIEAELRKKDEEEAQKRDQKRKEQINAGRPGRRRVRGAKAHQVSRENEYNTQPKQEIDEVEVREIIPKRNHKDEEEEDLVGTVSKRRNVADHISQLGRLDITLSTFRSHNLTAINPQHVILMDPNLQFTRELERYSAQLHISQGINPLHVYFMYYQRSVEELQYLTTMRREKDAFTKLIREKGLMPMVFSDENEHADHFDTETRIVRPTETASGVAGAAKRTYATTQSHRVVVDAREFRSALPYFIWQQRMEVIPLTLLVGDYVLTPELVVERKSLADLVGSFRNGRLYEQCESMLKYYKIAVLLIEFDGPSHFSMEPFREIRSRASNDIQREIQDNLSALLIRFPKLRLIWASSPLHTAQIFRGLKEAELEPEPAECAMAGKSVLYESLALSMLESLPGITATNAHLLAGIASTMKEVAMLSEEQLIKSLGIENGRRLYRFITRETEQSI